MMMRHTHGTTLLSGCHSWRLARQGRGGTAMRGVYAVFNMSIWSASSALLLFHPARGMTRLLGRWMASSIDDDDDNDDDNNGAI